MLGYLFYELICRVSQNWQDTPTNHVYYAVVSLFVVVLLNTCTLAIIKERRSPPNLFCYNANVPLAGLWGTVKSSIRFTSLLTEAYKTYLVKDIPCSIPDVMYGSTSTLTLLPTSALKWMLKQPANVLDQHGESQQGVQEMRHLSWHAETPYEHPVHGATTHGWMRRWIGAQFDASKDDTMAAIYDGLDQQWGNNTEAWTEVDLLKSLMPVFHQYTWRSIAGASHDKNASLWQYGFIMSALSIPASLVLHLFPSRLRSTAARIVGLPSRYLFWRLEGILMPLIQQRISEYKTCSDRHLDDYISWAVRNDAQQRGLDHDTPRRIISLVVSLSMLMNTSPSIVTHGLNELLQAPRLTDYEEGLRTEIQRVLNEEDSHWTKSTLSKLHGLDSMLREILRLYPISAVAPLQMVVADIEIPLANGEQSIHVRKGTRVGIPAHNIHMDEAYYEKPNEFDPWRFMSSRSRRLLESDSQVREIEPIGATALGGPLEKKKLALLSPSNMWFGWGMGKGSCPGRWIAHDTMKLVFSAILMRYEIRAITPTSICIQGQRRKAPTRFGPFLPPNYRKILVRRRKLADEKKIDMPEI